MDVPRKRLAGHLLPLEFLGGRQESENFLLGIFPLVVKAAQKRHVLASIWRWNSFLGPSCESIPVFRALVVPSSWAFWLDGLAEKGLGIDGVDAIALVGS